MIERQLKPRQEFTQLLSDKHFIDDESIAPSHDFSDTATAKQFIPEQRDAKVELGPLGSNPLTVHTTFWGKLAYLGLGMVLLCGLAQLGEKLYWLWSRQQWLGLGVTLGVALILLAVVGGLVRELRMISRLRYREVLRQEAEQFIGQGKLSYLNNSAEAFCQRLIQESSLKSNHPAVIAWQKNLHPSQTSQQVLKLYAQQVQLQIDHQAQQLIRRYALGSAAMVAMSPFSLLDMLIVAWRNLAMVNQIAQLYGIQPGRLARLRLFRQVLFNIAFAGVSEILQESGIEWLSHDLAAKLSGRIAQGIGIGLLTARLGIKTMELCRPLPWFDEKPRLSSFRRLLLKQFLRDPV